MHKNRVLRLNGLDTKGFESKLKVIEGHLALGNFRAASAKKLTGTSFYRAKLDDAARLVFKIGQYRNEKVIMLLEILRNHNYAASRCLRGIEIDDTKLEDLADGNFSTATAESLRSLHPDSKQFNFLDKIIIFDEDQEHLYQANLPIIIIGSAGSGKTAITLEKMKQMEGEILYVTQSPYLVNHARTQYYGNYYVNERQDISFLSFREYLETIKIPEGKELTFHSFLPWISRHRQTLKGLDPHMVFEEFKGVLTGSCVDRPFLTRTDYLNLGVKQSIFIGEQRTRVYDLFGRFLDYLSDQNLFETNIISHRYLDMVEPRYDGIVIDEVQDLTMVQLTLLLKALKTPSQFILCGDSNQIVHPNFFSWARLKTLFYARATSKQDQEIIRILTSNYRSSSQVTELANDLLRIKNARFGSIDRESNYLIKPHLDTKGEVSFLPDKDNVKKDLDSKTRFSTKYAVLVMQDEHKVEARKFFNTPLIFSVREAKGLEYENVILFNLVSSHRQEFLEISDGISPKDLEDGELVYSRAKDKQDKSLEAYKFFINAFYVAISRAVNNLILIEKDHQHRIFSLLKLNTKETISLKEEKSNREDWQKEALRLEKQGKLEQAAAIRDTILTTEKVPWDILDVKDLPELMTKSYTPKLYDKKSQRLLLGYGITYHENSIYSPMVNANFSLAGDKAGARKFVKERFFGEFIATDKTQLNSNLKRHGVNYQNPLRFTPLHAAAWLGDVELVKRLIKEGASLDSLDLMNRSPFEVALTEALNDDKFAKEKFAPIFDLLAPPSINIKVDNRLIKIDQRHMEYVMLFVSMAMTPLILREKSLFSLPAFQSIDFVDAFEAIPETVLPDRRKQRNYISSILSKNEIFREGPYNRRLFVRVGSKPGYYFINPMLEIERNGDWVKIFDLLPIDHIYVTSRSQRTKSFIEQYKKMRDQITEERKAYSKPPQKEDQHQSLQ